jgi:hypothetical protein
MSVALLAEDHLQRLFPNPGLKASRVALRLSATLHCVSGRALLAVVC